MPIFVSLLLIALIGYLWGAIPSGYWMGKILRGKDFDVRDYGSHKTGATNVRRTLGNGPALIVLLVDLSKGIGPALLATLLAIFNGAGWGPTVAGISALLGHCFPIFIGFRGGRGVMTGGGASLVLSPLSFILGLIVTIGTIATSRYVSLGSILGGVAIIISGIIFGILGRITFPQMVGLIVLPAIVIAMHYDNIGRLIQGKERKLGQKENIPAKSTPATNTSSSQKA